VNQAPTQEEEQHDNQLEHPAWYAPLSHAPLVGSNGVVTHLEADPEMTTRRSALAATLAVVVLASCQTAFEGEGTFVDVSGGQIHYWCDGGDGPTVMFVSAIGGDDTLVDIANRLSGETNACFSFRPGDGDTEPPPDARTAADDAQDLHELLAVLDVTSVVLVPHSYGGLVSLVFAAEHPDEVAGAVFVDASQPDAEVQMYEVMTEAQRAYFDGRLADFPYVEWPTSLDQARAAQPTLPNVPVTVITATNSFTDPCDEQLPCEDLQEIWLDVQATFAETITPDAHHVLAHTSHYVHLDDPDLVESEIRALLDRLK
jgi:pimeloyl-ACP methyl ester carboxylesterase